MNLIDNQRIFAGHLALLITKANEMGFAVTMGECQRPVEMQELYFKSGRSKTMNSMHIVRLAADLNLFCGNRLCVAAEIKPLGKWWEDLDPANRWGGSWRGLVESGASSFIDSPHFERKV